MADSMGRVKFNVKSKRAIAKLEKLGQVADDEIRKGMVEACELIRNRAKKNHRFKNRTHRLQDKGISYEVDRNRKRSLKRHRGVAPHTGTVFLNKNVTDRDGRPYGYFVHQGYAEHTIVARRSELLVFYWEKKRKWVKTPQVRHPGYKGDNFLERAIRYSRKEVNDIFRKRYAEAVRGANKR